MSLLREPPNPADGDALEMLRRALESNDFTVEGIEEKLGASELSLRPIDTAVQLRRLGDDAFGTLASVFLFGAAADANRLASVIAPLELTRLADAGLLVISGGQVSATARLAPHGDYYIASDGSAESYTSHDFVPGIQSPSVTLAKLAVRRRTPARWTSAPAAESRRSSPRSMPNTSSQRMSTHARSRLRGSTPG